MPTTHSLTPYRRHTKDCVKAGNDKSGLCDCVIWVRGRVTPDTEPIRRSLHTSSAEAAHREIADIARGLDGHPKATTVKEAVAAFMEERKDEDLNLAESTLQLDGYTFAPFVKALGHFDIKTLRPADITHYRRNIRRVKDSTWRRDLIKIRSFFIWCVKRKYCTENCAEEVPVPIANLLCTPPFEPGEVARLLDACDSIGGTGIVSQSDRLKSYSRRRARALVLTLLHTGLRISDVALLKRSALNMKTRHLTLRTLKSGDRTQIKVQLPAEAVAALIATPSTGDAQYFFWSGKGIMRSCANGLGEVLKRLGSIAGVDNVHAHRFRDTFATELLCNGVDVRTVQMLLGHASIQTTEKFYAHFIPRHQALLDTATAGLRFGHDVGAPVLLNPGNSRRRNA